MYPGLLDSFVISGNAVYIKYLESKSVVSAYTLSGYCIANILSNSSCCRKIIKSLLSRLLFEPLNFH